MKRHQMFMHWLRVFGVITVLSWGALATHAAEIRDGAGLFTALAIRDAKNRGLGDA